MFEVAGVAVDSHDRVYVFNRGEQPIIVNEPADIAAAVVFLASPAARNITGQSINVDGGTTTS